MEMLKALADGTPKRDPDGRERDVPRASQDRLGCLRPGPAGEAPAAPAVQGERHEAVPGDAGRLGQGARGVVEKIQGRWAGFSGR
jgi:hypothetical protein